MSIVRRDVSIVEWLEIKYDGIVHLVAVESLMEAYVEKMEERKLCANQRSSTMKHSGT